MATNEDSVLSQYVPGFRANLNLAPQQTTSRLLTAVDEDLNYDTPGQFFNADDIGVTDPDPVISRIPDTPDKFLSMVRRVGAFAPFADAAWIDTVDKARELEDPTSKTMEALMAGRWRRPDTAILAGLVGNAYALAGPNTVPTAVALPAAQVVASNDISYQPDSEVLPTDGSEYGMSVAKLLHAKMILDNSDLEGDRYLAITPSEEADLLRRTPTTSQFYADVRALVQGKITMFMGFNIIRVPAKRFIAAGAYTLGNDGVSPIYQCPAWIKSAMIYKGRPITSAQIFRRPDKSMRIQALYEMEDGACRRYDTAVVRIDCYTGAAY